MAYSFSSTTAIVQSRVFLWPVEFTTRAYQSVYPFIQRYFIRGMMIGSLKE